MQITREQLDRLIKTKDWTAMWRIFADSEFSHPLDSFDTSNVKNMQSMFLNCKYTKPMPWAENIPLDIEGATEIVEMYEKEPAVG